LAHQADLDVEPPGSPNEQEFNGFTVKAVFVAA